MLPNNTFPKSGFNKPVMRLNIVDFPAPFGPNKPKISPGFILKDILSNIFLCSNDIDIFLTSSNGSVFLKDLILNF